VGKDIQESTGLDCNDNTFERNAARRFEHFVLSRIPAWPWIDSSPKAVPAATTRHRDVAWARNKAERSRRIQRLSEVMLVRHLDPQIGRCHTSGRRKNACTPNSSAPAPRLRLPACLPM
jgi:hypothetical protein